jgi:hypothetical protein
MRARITGIKINQKSFDKTVGSAEVFQKRAEELINKRLMKEKQNLLKDFDEHPVTKEIDGGAGATNLSGTLAGYGNLFSFIGFESGSLPTQAVRQFLSSFVKIKKGKKNRGLSIDFDISLPTMEDFNFAKMPWESGNNWVRSIETGISNFSYFMHKAHGSSRSGQGIQIDHKIRISNSKSVPYMTEILNKFKKRMRSNK